jgi:uncharacterized membrane protein YdbT with pleckstrin-like domain
MYYQRPLDPEKPVMSEEIRQKCEASRAKYPKLNLSDGEYVIRDVRRHPIGLFQIWGAVAVVVLAVLGILAFLMAGSSTFGATSGAAMPLALGALLICALAMIAGYVGTFVYTANRFYLTNESVIQNIQTSLFSNREQTVSLSNVEDASYSKHGIIQNILDFGQIRLSTQGDETTYRFNFASHPSEQVAQLNNAVEAFKNGRPVYDDDDPAHGRAHH